jgi:hypothetical protein
MDSHCDEESQANLGGRFLQLAEENTLALEITSPIIRRGDLRGAGSGPTHGRGLFFTTRSSMIRFASDPSGANNSFVPDEMSISSSACCCSSTVKPASFAR